MFAIAAPCCLITIISELGSVVRADQAGFEGLIGSPRGLLQNHRGNKRKCVDVIVITGVSKSILTIFWEKYGFSIRAAYNLRDYSYAGLGQAGSDQQYYQVDPLKSAFLNKTVYSSYVSNYPEFNKRRGQLDLSISYEFENSVEIFGSVKNALNTPAIKYMGTPETTQYQTSFSDSGIQYSLGVKYKTDF